VKKVICAIVAAFIFAGLTPVSRAAVSLEAVAEDAARYVYSVTAPPVTGTTSGEWAVLSLLRSGYALPEGYVGDYYESVEKYTREREGVLHSLKYTEYSRVSLALTAAGYDPRDVAGYDLIAPLGDYEATLKQGINGPIWALLALDSKNYPVPISPGAKTQATRERYVSEILRRQLSDGRFTLAGDPESGASSSEPADPDVTGMALQALAKYRETPGVNAAIDKALDYLSKTQNPNGGYNSLLGENAESAVQVLIALCALGIAENDARFVKNGVSVLERILYYRESDGSFRHDDKTGTNLMTTQQALLAVTGVLRARNNRPTLYDMSDVAPAAPGTSSKPNRNPDVREMPVILPGKTFDDIAGETCKKAVEELASRGIISGVTDTRYNPSGHLTRGQFAAIVTRGLGLYESYVDVFGDVARTAWYCGYVGTAYTYGIVRGVSDARFNPEGTITREEAAVMLSRAASLCGENVTRGDDAARNILSVFEDYTTISAWAKAETAYCVDVGIIADDGMTLTPKGLVTRGEMAQMLYRLLAITELI
jgi:hypothetical protein